MTLLVRTVPINVAADGTDLTTVRLGPSVLRMIRVELGTLSTPDITITEQDNNKNILTVAALATDKDYFPSVLASNTSGVDVVGAGLGTPILGRLEIAIAGAGVSTSGEITFLYEH